MDLMIDQVDDGWSSESTRSLIRSLWARNAELQSWFVLVDRPTRGSDTMYLNATVGDYRRDSTRVGTPKHGYTTIHSVEVNVTFELIDASTGTVVAASIGRGSDSRSGSSADAEAALRRGIDTGLVRLIRVYAGEG